MLVTDLGQLAYRDAWAVQERAHAAVLAGGEEQLLLVEHPPVVTLGRRPDASRNLLAPEDQFARLGIELVQSDRGGDVTFHGPGQIVAYPIVRLIDHRLSVGAYVRRLLHAAIDTLAEFGIPGQIDSTAMGVWTPVNDQLAKICAVGVRIRRGVSLHGIALNVSTDLNYFRLIIPCGLARPVTSMQQILQDRTPPLEQVKGSLQRSLVQAFATAKGLG